MAEPATTRVGDFTPQAAHYVARPSYPGELLDVLLAHAGVGDGDAVADIGAGTGIFTNLLAGRGLRVSAVEPNASMATLAEPRPSVRWTAGTFESTGLAVGSQAWVTAAQSFHWADSNRALPELRRVLRDGACLTAVWNDRDNAASKWLGVVRGLINRYAPGFDELYRDRDWPAVLTSTGDFGDAAYHEHHHAITMPRERFVSLWRSHNRLNAAAGPRGMSRLIADLEGELATAGTETIDVPYVCRAYSVRRA